MSYKTEFIGIVSAVVGIASVNEVTAVVSALCALTCTVLSIIKALIKTAEVVKKWRSGKASTVDVIEALDEAINDVEGRGEDET